MSGLGNQKQHFFELFIALLSIALFFLQGGCNDNATNPPSTKADTSWTYLGLGSENIASIGLDPTNPNVIYAGSRYNFSAGTPGRLFKSSDGGNSWDTLLVDPGAIFHGIVVDPQNPQIVYAAPWGVIKSNNGGTTWQALDNGIQTFPGETHVMCLIMDPFDSNVLYAGTGGPSGGGLYKTTDAGTRWSAVGNDSLGDGVISIAIDPSNTSIIYAGTAGTGILWKSTDAGINWKRTGLGKTQGLLYGLLADSGGQVYGGCTWAPSGYLSPAPWHGFFRSDNGGVSWQEVDEGLPDSAGVSRIVQQRNTSDLFCSVSTLYGKSGIYEMQSGIDRWVEIGVNSTITSSDYLNSDLKVSTDQQTLFYGGEGIFKLVLK